MSKQLSISASFSVLAMAAMALFASPLSASSETGAPTFAGAPAYMAIFSR